MWSFKLQENIFLRFEFEFVFWKNVSNQCFLPIRWPVLVWNAILLNWCKSVWKFGKNPWKFHLNIPIFSSLMLVFVENLVSAKPSNHKDGGHKFVPSRYSNYQVFGQKFKKHFVFKIVLMRHFRKNCSIRKFLSKYVRYDQFDNMQSRDTIFL